MSLKSLIIAWVTAYENLKTAGQVRQSPPPGVVSCFHTHEECSYEAAKFQELSET